MSVKVKGWTWWALGVPLVLAACSPTSRSLDADVRTEAAVTPDEAGALASDSGESGNAVNDMDAGTSEAGQGPGDGGPCPPGEQLLYTRPGCGADAGRPVCVGERDACAAPSCSCDGEDIVGCGNYEQRYRHGGLCDPFFDQVALPDGSTEEPPSTMAMLCSSPREECTPIAQACDLLADVELFDCNRPREQSVKAVACAVEAAANEKAFFLAGARSVYLGLHDDSEYEIRLLFDWGGAGEVNARACQSLTTVHEGCSALGCMDCVPPVDDDGDEQLCQAP